MKIRVALAFILAGCGSSEAGPADPSATPSSKLCFQADKSRELGSAVDLATAPYETCTADIEMHCGGNDGERGPLCGFALSVERTQAARVTQLDMCCYGDGK
jgi:hypothetical protein